MTKQKWKDINERKSERYAQIGLETEEAIAAFLRNAVDGEERPIFEEVIHHKRFSQSDLNGKDITVYRKIGGIVLGRSFGVTISIKRFHKTQNTHANIPVFYTPIGFNPQHLLSKVLGLFN